MKEIVVLCAGDFGREVVWLIEGINKAVPRYSIRGFLDDDKNKHGQVIDGYKCLGPASMLDGLGRDHHVSAVIATQDGRVRKMLAGMFPDFGRWETLVHPSANISDRSAVGKGCIICANSSVSVGTKIGDHCIMNLSATVGHDCDIGDFVSVMSGAVVSGHVTIHDNAYLGSNSTVVPGKKIGVHAKVGAGSVVIRNVKDNSTVIGVPAQMLRV